MTLKKRLIITVLAIVAIVVGRYYWKNIHTTVTNSDNPSSSNLANQILSTTFGEPVDRAQERVTKKPFGIYITPTHSPVSPEKFTGYHTGVDFETFPDEQNKDVNIYAICDGILIEKITATGYGGVAVERCQLNGQSITVTYGHLRFSSVSIQSGQTLKKGEGLGVLGTGYSSETSGERKHLHLGIHRGPTVDIRGYVQKQSELADWIDYMNYHK